jgi:CRP-like cAMP-binding protein
MSLLRESEGSTNIARPKPSHRISAAAQNSTQVRRGSKNGREFDPHAFLATIGEGRKAMLFPKKQTIFAQGDRADAVFYLQTGKVKLTVVSKTGKEATIGILSDRSFFGEGSLAGQPLRGFGNGNDRLCCAANRKESDGGCASSGTRVFRPIRSVFARAQCPLRRGSGRPTV